GTGHFVSSHDSSEQFYPEPVLVPVRSSRRDAGESKQESADGEQRRVARARHAVDVQDYGTVWGGEIDGGLREPRLADAGFPNEADDASMSTPRVGPGLGEAVKHVAAADNPTTLLVIPLRSAA